MIFEIHHTGFVVCQFDDYLQYVFIIYKLQYMLFALQHNFLVVQKYLILWYKLLKHK